MLSSTAFDGQRGRVLRGRTLWCALFLVAVRPRIANCEAGVVTHVPNHPEIASLLKQAFLHSEQGSPPCEVRCSSHPASFAFF